jgi:hypothetical protein
MSTGISLYPNVIIGGAPKCGTSSLYFWLASHPEVYGSPKKETFFFSDKVNRFNSSANIHEHDIKVYESFFKGGETAMVRFEATAHYLYESTAREYFSKWNIPPKMIFLFREPSKQVYSHFKMEKYRTKRIKMELTHYVEQPNILNKVDYVKHLKVWIEAMPEGYVRFWAFEDFMSRKESVMKEIAEYVGVDPSFYDRFDFEHRNESVAIKSGFLHQLGLKIQPLIPHAIQKAVLPLYMKINSGGRVADRPEDQPVLAQFKQDWAHVGEALKELDPNFPIGRWS